MEFIGHFRRLTPVQRNTFIACFLGWSLDAFDFFILNFCISAIATQFQAKVSAVAEAIFLTLFVLTSQNRQRARDRIRSDIEFESSINTETKIAYLHEKIDRLTEAHYELRIGMQKLLSAKER